MSEDIDKLKADFEAAARRIKEVKAGKLQGVEDAYGLAYQALVKAGVMPQIRKKYRGQ